MNKRQKYGLKYPFTTDNGDGYFVDLNETVGEGVKSRVLHVIFTPKGQKLRDPEFGTDLIKFIFEPNDNVTWEGIKNEVSTIVSKYLKGVMLKNIEVMQNENDFSEIYVRIDYSVSNGINVVNDSLVTKI